MLYSYMKDNLSNMFQKYGLQGTFSVLSMKSTYSSSVRI